MNLSSSQCSSGSESGWTLYLDQSSHSKKDCYSFGVNADEEHAEKGDSMVNDAEEDLSMVSDASSGPRHYCEDEYCFENSSFRSLSASELAQKSKKKKKIKEHGRNQQHSYLDDTASSPVLGFSKKNISFSNNETSMEHVLDFSQGFSATHLEGKSAFKKHFDFFKSSRAEKPAAGESGGFQ